MVAILSITFFTIDTTRVFSILFIPFLLYAILIRWNELIEKERRIALSLVAVALLWSLFVPLFYKWVDKIIFLDGTILQ
ncbi:hypothetical protein CH373_18245 [Leptospira perolatii]|uniref:Uncharacterized protein n=1 Tax=Leptospira perolatii TaxID=2023191 RepID=A0A2M9ZHZ1_9LEPT|nr:hypothetical protein [Leptospira perolatii]PJZ68042.1 hypothetical protein CH360_18265 [Leptospira perolatii]PJZ71678.1 hypothetical protein CH373_18245 [Leptospira perolatii]